MEYVWTFFFVLIGIVALMILAIVIARVVRGPRSQLGPINQPAGTPPPANNAAAQPAAAVGGNIGWDNLVTWKSFITLLAVLCGAFVLYLLAIGYDWLSVVLGIAALAAMWIGFLLTDKKKLGTFLYVTVLVLLVYWLYKNGQLEVGQRRYIFYPLAIVAGALVWTYATTFKEKLTFGILVGALFLMLGFSHIDTWEEFKERMASYVGGGAGGTSSITKNVVVRSGCANAYEKFVITRIQTPLPDNCKFDYSVKSGIVVFTLSDGSELPVYPGQKVTLYPGVKYSAMRAGDATAEIHTAFCTVGTSWDGNRCS